METGNRHACKFYVVSGIRSIHEKDDKFIHNSNLINKRATWKTYRMRDTIKKIFTNCRVNLSGNTIGVNGGLLSML